MLRKTYCLLFLLFCGFFSPNKVNAQDLFDIDTIRTVEINFYDANWDHLLDSLAMLGVGTGSGTGRILAEVIIDGNVFDSCGVRYKGNSSMDTASFKNPFNIDLNWTVGGQQYLGKNKIKLANCFTDPSMVREALMYELSNQYMDGPHANFVKLYTNGVYRGIYTNTESVDNEFLDKYYGSSNNSFFKCDPVNFDLAAGNSNLAYYADSMAYDTLYDMKSSFGLADLQELCFNLENNILNIEQYFDVDRALWFLALSSAFVHNDGYTAFQHNYYVYKMDNGRWSITIWDVNMSFGGLLWNGTNWLPLGLPALQNQDPFLHEFDFNIRPLISQLLSIPKYRKMYVAHYRTIMEENVDNDYYLERAEYMSSIIDADVVNEPFSAYTYTEFTDNVYNDVGTWIDLRPGLENLMNTRKTYINSLPEFQFSQPVISNVNVSNNQPPAFSTVTFTAEVMNGLIVELGYRHSHFDVFTKIQMFDDGLHNDGAPGDGTYGVDAPVGMNNMEYYIIAENGNSTKFSPVRAEYEFYVLNPQKGVVINEICAINTAIAFDQNFEYDDWIELYNNSSVPVSLNGYHLSDNAGNPTKWTFPDTIIGANEYLIVWADIDTFQVGLHANFSLASIGEGVHLSDNFGIIVDEVIYPPETANITYGRYGNGLGNFMYLYPTFGSMNTTPLDLEELNENTWLIYPNPTSGKTTVSFNDSYHGLIRVLDLTGNILLEDKIEGLEEYLFDTVGFAPGLYFIHDDFGRTFRLVVQ